MKTISRVKIKWFYAILLGFCNILDGLSMILTLGHWSTNLSLKMALIGAVNAWCTLKSSLILGTLVCMKAYGMGRDPGG